MPDQVYSKAQVDELMGEIRQRMQANAPIFPIWAEENGAIANNAYEWSWGNGATGSAIGIVVPLACELFAVSVNAEVAGTSMTMRTEKNGADAHVSTHAGANSTVDLPTPVEFAAGDRVSFRTGTLTGSFSDVRVCAWFRVILP